MTEFQKDILAIIKSAITREKPSVSEKFDWNKAYSLCKAHQILGIFFVGASNLDAFKLSEAYSLFEHSYCSMLAQSERQIYDLKSLFDAFIKNEISFLPLKGIPLKKEYPHSEMRTMSDADILIKINEYENIKRIMRQLEYVEGKENDHEFHWKSKGGLEIELHKRIIPSETSDFGEYYDTGWERAKKNENGYEYHFFPEDFFVFLICHFAKHYRGAGAGIKYILDFYVLKNNYKNMDFAYISAELKKLNLFDFYENITNMLGVWFDGKENEPKSNFLTDNIFYSGTYGVLENSAYFEGLKSSQKSKHFRIKNMVYILFMPYSYMVKRYKILKPLPFLLPFLWVYRWFEVLLFRPENIKIRLKKERLKSKENILKYQKELKYVGLDCDFTKKEEK